MPRTTKRVFARREECGTSMVEMSIATTILALVMALAVPFLKTVGDAGEEGQKRVSVQGDNYEALVRIAGELQNASTRATDAAGNFRFTILDGSKPQPLRDARSGDLGGYEGKLGDYEYAHRNTDGGPGGGGSTATNVAKGSGARGGTHIGRARQTTLTGSSIYGGAPTRPRRKAIPTNSILRFQKVTGFVVAADGSPEIQWSTPIEYRVAGRKLLRVDGTETRVIAPNVVGFRVELTDAGTLSIALVSQTRANSTGRIQFQANQIEVSPKN